MFAAISPELNIEQLIATKVLNLTSLHHGSRHQHNHCLLECYDSEDRQYQCVVPYVPICM